MVLGEPETREVSIKQLDSVKDQIGSVHLLGHGEPLKWKMTDKGLEVSLPKTFTFKYALALKIKISKAK